MALVQTKTMIRSDWMTDWYDMAIVPARFLEDSPGQVEVESDASFAEDVRTDVTTWADLDAWEETWTHEEEWQPTYDYWAANEITVTWTLVDDSTGEVIRTVTRPG